MCYNKSYTFAATIAMGMWANAMSVPILIDDFSSTCQLDRMSYTERRKPLSSCRENSCTSTLMNLHNRQKHRSRLRVFKCIKALNYLTEICFKLLILRGMKVCFVCIITGVTYNQTFSFP